MKYYIMAGLLLSTQLSFAQDIRLENVFNNENRSCNFESCFQLDEVISRAGKLSFESQEGLLDLFMARQNIKVRSGQLLPSFNLRIGNPVDVFDYIPNLVGFLFPSNWFRLKESKLHEMAQRNSYISLVANQKSMAAQLYFTSHQEVQFNNILTTHRSFVTELQKLMEVRFDQGDVAAEDLEEVKSFGGKLSSDIVLQKNYVRELNADISYLVNSENQFEHAGPALQALPDISLEEPIDAKILTDRALKASPELISFDFLAEAARFSKKARGYDFLTPDSGTENAFGFGYRANLRIGSAEIEMLKIKRKAFVSNIKRSLVKITSQINSSINIYTLAVAREESLKFILQSLLDDFSLNSRIDINRFLALTEENIENQQSKMLAQHNFIQGKIQLERLLMEADIYTSIQSEIPRPNSKDLDCYLRKENKQIAKALNAGELKVPQKISFENDDLKFCM